MVDMETTKVAIIRVVGIMTIKVVIMAMIIKVDIVAMIIKVDMVVDMAINKADMGTIKKMVDITETQEVVCEEDAIGVTKEREPLGGRLQLRECELSRGSLNYDGPLRFRVITRDSCHRNRMRARDPYGL